MAATIARAEGQDTNRVKSVHRLGSRSSQVQAATWHTFAEAYVYKNGSGYIQIARDGKVLHRFEFGPEREKERTS